MVGGIFGRGCALPTYTGGPYIAQYAITMQAPTTKPSDFVSRASIKNTLDLREDGGIKPQTAVSALETRHYPPELIGEILLI